MQCAHWTFNNLLSAIRHSPFSISRHPIVGFTVLLSLHFNAYDPWNWSIWWNRFHTISIWETGFIGIHFISIFSPSFALVCIEIQIFFIFLLWFACGEHEMKSNKQNKKIHNSIWTFPLLLLLNNFFFSSLQFNATKTHYALLWLNFGRYLVCCTFKEKYFSPFVPYRFI